MSTFGVDRNQNIIYTKMKDLQIIRPSELARLTSVSKQTLWRMEKRGELPPRVKISKRAVGWTRKSISDWLDQKSIKAETNQS